MHAIKTQGLSKRFGDFYSLRNCTLEVKEGSVLGLLGPNGAGKSTLIRTLLGFLKPTAGRAEVFGHDVARESLLLRHKVSYLPGDARLYRTLKGSSIIGMFAEMHPCGDRQRSTDIARRLGLDLSRRVAFMSTGMRQKLAISIVIGCQAPLLILDEPTANLDPDVRREVLGLVREASTQGRTILLSSHLFSDIENTCDEVALLRSGELAACVNLSDNPESHIAIGHAGTDRLPDIQRQLSQPFVLAHRIDNNTACQTAAPAASGNRATLTLELAGNPNTWMPWLAETVELQDLVIRRAGIEALYDRYSKPESHSSADQGGVQ